MSNSSKNFEIDAIDRKIIGILQRDASLSHAVIGEQVGLSASTVNERIRKLRTHHVIKKIVALVDPEQIGAEIFAYIMISVVGPEHEMSFGKSMIGIDEVLECHHVTGEYSYLIKVRAKNMASLEFLLVNRIKTLPGVNRSFTQIVLSSFKEETAIMC